MTPPDFDLGPLRPGPRFDQWRPAPLQYVALDVDGTTSAGGIRLSDEVVVAREELRDVGIPVGPATGRGALHMQEISAAMRYDAPGVLHNGAEIIDAGGAVLQRTSLGLPLTAALMALARERGWLLEAYHADTWYVTDIEAFMVELKEFTEMAAKPTRMPAEPFDGTKATIVVRGASQVEQLHRELAEHDVTLEPHVVPTDEGVLWVNVTRSGVDKGAALRRIFELHRIDPARTLAVGDGANDVSMLQAAGTAIAMGQAGASVQEHAHFIAPSVFDDGAAAALRFAAQFASV